MSNYKGTDKEGRIRLGHDYANKQWQVTELSNGAIVLVPMVAVTDEDAQSVFDKMFAKHKKTLDALQ